MGPFGLGPFLLGTYNNPVNPTAAFPTIPAGWSLAFRVRLLPAPTLSGGFLDYNNDVANAAINGLTVTAMERVQYFQLTANYTYSHTIDNGNFTTFINLPPNQFDYA